MINNIFETDNSCEYIKFRLKSLNIRGAQSHFAKAIECDGAYVSRILEGVSNLSLEQAFRANQFFIHTEEESEFFLCLVGLSRAGTKELKQYYKQKLAMLREANLTLSKRIKKTEKLQELTEATYYSFWLYAAIDMATCIETLQTVEALSAHFHVPHKATISILSFLRDSGLVEQVGPKWVNTNKNIYLSSESPHIRKHHLNWRLKAMQLIESAEQDNLHYSTVAALSQKDFEKLKEKFIETVTKAREIVKGSKEEILMGYNIDCYRI